MRDFLGDESGSWGGGGGAPSQAREPENHLGLNRTVNKIFQDDKSI
jgi:hypothetical protein